MLIIIIITIIISIIIIIITVIIIIIIINYLYWSKLSSKASMSSITKLLIKLLHER